MNELAAWCSDSPDGREAPETGMADDYPQNSGRLVGFVNLEYHIRFWGCCGWGGIRQSSNCDSGATRPTLTQTLR